jgi:hypothetical protein
MSGYGMAACGAKRSFVVWDELGPKVCRSPSMQHICNTMDLGLKEVFLDRRSHVRVMPGSPTFEATQSR